MSNAPEELKYTKTHEWTKGHGDGTFTVGVTDHAQDLLGDMVFIETPEVGAHYNAGDDCAVVESVKAASDIYSPISGEVISVNEKLLDNPEMVNKDPYGDGWLFVMKATDAEEADELLDAETYLELAEAETH